MLEMGLILALALVFDFTNGMQGSANVVSTLIFSRSLTPRAALWLAAIAEGLGPFIFGVAVASTVGEDFVRADAITATTVLAGLLGAIFWNVLTIWAGIPSSASHALIGGLMGAAIAESGVGVIQQSGFLIILAALIISPLLGLLFSYLLTKAIYFMAAKARPSVNRVFKRAQIVTSVLLALVFGSNDAQKVMGMITLGLILTGYQDDFFVPGWVMVVSAFTLALGTFVGGARLIKTMGARFYKVRPVHGLAAQSSATSVILVAGLLGGPVSTTHVVSSSIIGAGSADRLTKVRWHIFDRIGLSWVLTIPAAGTCAAIFLLILKGIQTYV